LIKNLWESKGYGARRLIRQFPNKNWKRRVIEDLLRKLRETGSLDRRTESGRPHTSRSCDNISAVEELTHFHKVAQVRYLGEVNMLFTCEHVLPAYNSAKII